MRDPLEILLWAVLAYMAGGVLSLLLSRNERAAITVSGLLGALGGALGFSPHVAGRVLEGVGRFAHGLAGFVACSIGVGHGSSPLGGRGAP